MTDMVEMGRRGGLRSAQVRAERRQLERQRNAAAYVIGQRDDIPTAMLELMDEAARRLMAGVGLPPVESALDALRYVELMAKAQTIARLELGESTSNALTLSVDPAQLLERLSILAATQPGAVDVEDVVDVPGTDIPEA